MTPTTVATFAMTIMTSWLNRKLALKESEGCWNMSVAGSRPCTDCVQQSMRFAHNPSLCKLCQMERQIKHERTYRSNGIKPHPKSLRQTGKKPRPPAHLIKHPEFDDDGRKLDWKAGETIAQVGSSMLPEMHLLTDHSLRGGTRSRLRCTNAGDNKGLTQASRHGSRRTTLTPGG